LCSLSVGDDDYSGHALTAIDTIRQKDRENINIFLETPSISAWIQKSEPGLYSEFVGGDTLSVASPTPRITSQVVEAAIKDAAQLIESRGAVNGLDRVAIRDDRQACSASTARPASASASGSAASSAARSREGLSTLSTGPTNARVTTSGTDLCRVIERARRVRFLV
jgi:hypothetical protein